jgi:hypothetical protein
MRRLTITGRGASLAPAAALALALAACSTDRILRVDDPDIIEAGVVQTPAGASAARAGALVQLNKATGGNDQVDASTSFFDTMVMLSGLLADEWRSGDTFVERDETDRRAVRSQNANVDVAYRALHRARVSAQLAREALQTYRPDAPAWEVAQMLWVEGYVETLVAEYFCGAAPMSAARLDGTVTPTAALSTADLLARAVAHLDSGLAALGAEDDAESKRVRNTLLVTKGRALLGLARPADAAAAVAGVPTPFAFDAEFNTTLVFNQLWDYNNNARRYTIAARDGGVGLDFTRLDGGAARDTAGDPRLPRCRGGDDACDAAAIGSTIFDSQNAATIPFWAQLRFPSRDTPWPYASGTEARLIEAEAQLAAGGGWLATLNALRAAEPGLAPLADPGTAAARVDLLFRERAFWLFGTGHRLGDLRRLVRQYGRAAGTVFPSGAYVKGGEYGADVSFPVPQAEENNPSYTPSACVTTQP